MCAHLQSFTMNEAGEEEEEKKTLVTFRLSS